MDKELPEQHVVVSGEASNSALIGYISVESDAVRGAQPRWGTAGDTFSRRHEVPQPPPSVLVFHPFLSLHVHPGRGGIVNIPGLTVAATRRMLHRRSGVSWLLKATNHTPATFMIATTWQAWRKAFRLISNAKHYGCESRPRKSYLRNRNCPRAGQDCSPGNEQPLNQLRV